jgi:gas vesicle protein
MNYKKLINDHLTNNTDKTPVVVALLSGLAIGAVLGVLFAPSSGSETRSLIADKSKDLTDSAKDTLQNYKQKLQTGANDLAATAKDKFQTYKEKVQTGADDLANLKDKAVESVKSKFSETKNDVLASAKQDIDNA